MVCEISLGDEEIRATASAIAITPMEKTTCKKDHPEMQQEAVPKNAGRKQRKNHPTRRWENVVAKITSFARLHNIDSYRIDNGE
jgi:hypothetical protein